MNSKSTIEKITDEKLLHQLLSGDENALKHIYRHHFKSVLHLVTTNSGNEDDAKDIYQDAICVLYDAVRKPDFSITCSINTFIYLVAKNLWLKELRKRSGGELRLDEGDDYIDYDVSDEIDKFTNEEQKIDVMNASLKELGEPCQTIITDFFYQKMSMEEIAAKMGYSNADTAKNQKYKCFVRLKKLIMSKNK